MNILFSFLVQNRRLVFDGVVRFLLALFFAFSAGQYFKNAFHHLTEIKAASMDAKVLVSAFSIFAIGLYSIMLAVLFAIRLKPVNKFAGIKPALVALLGGFLMMGLMLIPPNENLSLPVAVVASLLVFLGNFLAFVVLLHLGKSFSILPEGRKLVTGGPYKYVRHPLYVAEGIGILGAMITFWSWEAVFLVVTQMLFQLGRMHYEEKVLRATFPDYDAYAAKTARLIPGIY